ncbi:MAG: sulfatase-like hydrolase/transferase [Planctomycetota bacterium]
MRTFSLFAAFVLAAVASVGNAAEDRPNIVLLFADDAGYADFGFQGSKHFRTPHLDMLASSGVVLKTLYTSAAVCGPSRAGLLTGRYQQRFGFEENNVPGWMSPSSKLLGDEMGLPLSEQTIADHLQSLGYRTAVFGKWHLGATEALHPLSRGFDEFVGFRGGARTYFALNHPGRPENRLERGRGTYREHEGYLTDALAEEACDFIRRHRDRPFFAFVSFNAVHAPMEADPADAATFANLKGTRRTAAQMMLSLDRACGRIVDQLAELGLEENTLVVFTNDNGGPMDRNGSSNYPLSGVKGTHLEGGIRVPGVAVWPGRLPAGETYEEPVSTLDLLPTFVAAGGGDTDAIDGLDGVNVLPFLIGEASGRPHETLYWKCESRAAIRDGDWKLIRYPDRPAELFDVMSDPGEQQDLAIEHPERTRELFRKLFAWEVELERPLFQAQRKAEVWSSKRADEFHTPPPADY